MKKPPNGGRRLADRLCAGLRVVLSGPARTRRRRRAIGESWRVHWSAAAPPSPCHDEINLHRMLGPAQLADEKVSLGDGVEENLSRSGRGLALHRIRLCRRAYSSRPANRHLLAGGPCLLSLTPPRSSARKPRSHHLDEVGSCAGHDLGDWADADSAIWPDRRVVVSDRRPTVPRTPCIPTHTPSLIPAPTPIVGAGSRACSGGHHASPCITLLHCGALCITDS